MTMNAGEFIHPRSSHETSRTPNNPGSSQQAARPEVQAERSIRLDGHRTIASERGDVHRPPVHDQPLLDSWNAPDQFQGPAAASANRAGVRNARRRTTPPLTTGSTQTRRPCVTTSDRVSKSSAMRTCPSDSPPTRADEPISIGTSRTIGRPALAMMNSSVFMA
jgi:hypothetical protein